MRFADFLRTTVLLSAASATVLAAVTAAGAANNADGLAIVFGALWWLLAAGLGGWFGRRAEASQAIATLLAGARTQPSLPQVRPTRTLLNRLWPLLLLTVGAGALAFT